MARPQGSARINLAWQMRVHNAIQTLSLTLEAFEAGDDTSQSRAFFIRDALAPLQALDSRSTNRDAYNACQEASKHLAYAFSLRAPR